MGSGKWRDNVFGERVRKLREGRWTQAELAYELTASGHPMTAAQVARIEAGTRSLRAVEAAALADLAGISMDALLGRRARPKADLHHAIRDGLAAKNEAARQATSLVHALRGAAATLAACAETDQRYLTMAAELEQAANAFMLAELAASAVGEGSNPELAAIISEGTKAVMRKWADEQEASK